MGKRELFMLRFYQGLTQGVLYSVSLTCVMIIAMFGVSLMFPQVVNSAPATSYVFWLMGSLIVFFFTGVAVYLVDRREKRW